MQNKAVLPFDSVAFIGFGNMATAITDSLLSSGLQSSQIHVYGGHQKTAELVDQYRVLSHKEGEDISENLLVVAVKPQVAEEILLQYKDKISKETIVLSIMAGVSYADLKEIFPNNQIIRSMPNLGAAYGQSTTALYTEDNCKEIAEAFCNLFGQSILLDEEEKMHAFTAVAGSGPAHFFYLMNEMINFTKEQGFSEVDARRIVAETAKAAVSSIEKSELNCGELIGKVASKGGTTEAAITYYEHKNANKMIKESLVAATRRSLNLVKK